VPRELATPVPLTGLALPDARSGEVIDLGALRGRFLLTVIRHRF
jgi:hypothetical protein